MAFRLLCFPTLTAAWLPAATKPRHSESAWECRSSWCATSSAPIRYRCFHRTSRFPPSLLPPSAHPHLERMNDTPKYILQLGCSKGPPNKASLCSKKPMASRLCRHLHFNGFRFRLLRLRQMEYQHPSPHEDERQRRQVIVVEAGTIDTAYPKVTRDRLHMPIPGVCPKSARPVPLRSGSHCSCPGCRTGYHKPVQSRNRHG